MKNKNIIRILFSILFVVAFIPNCVGAWLEHGIPGKVNPKGFKQVSTGAGNHVWATNTADNVFQFVKRKGWLTRPGGLKKVVVNSKGRCWGINKKNQVFNWGKILFKWKWLKRPGRLTDISFGGKLVIGVGTNKRPYLFMPFIGFKIMPSKTAKGKQLDFEKISVHSGGKKFTLGITSETASKGNLYMYNKRPKKKSHWRKFPSEMNLREIAVGKYICGIGRNDGAPYVLSRKEREITLVWNKMSLPRMQKVKSISVGADGNILCVDVNGSVYHWSGKLPVEEGTKPFRL
jgi:hypothetical protein